MSVSLNYDFNYNNPKIVFVSGGPGCGKGTQCERLVRDYHFNHISVGDVVRDEIQRGTPEGETFKELAARGDLVPDNLVVQLIIKTIKNRKSLKYLIDGFPRGVEQAKLFEKKFKEIDYILNFDVPDKVLIDRLLSRGQTSGRSDDNEEAIANRLNVFHSKTQPVLDFYNHFGKVKTIDGQLSVDEVFKKVQDAIKPNVIFLYGAPSVGKTECSRRLAEKIKYHFLNLEAFDKQYNVKNETDRINKLINYLQFAPHNNFIIDDFFQTQQNAEIFVNHFAKPYKVFYLESSKDEVMNNISKFIVGAALQKQKKAQYEVFIKQRSGILSLIQNESYFSQINAVDTIPNIVRNILTAVKPLVISAFTYNNMDLGLEYCDLLEKKRDFIFLDLQEHCQNEIDRGTHLGAKMNAFESTGQAIPTKLQIELLQKVLFANPNQRRFVLTKFPERINQFEQFETDLFPIDYLITFYYPQQQVKYYHELSPLLQYFSKGRYIHIDRDALDIVDAYITNRANYGFVIGPTASGKTSISKYVASKFQYTLVEWEPTIESLKIKLGTEEAPLEEVTYPLVEKYFVDLLNPAKNSGKTLFDGWPAAFTFAQFQQFISKLGLPNFVIDLQIEKKAHVRRYKVKNEQDPEGETTEEDNSKIDEIVNNASQYTQFIGEQAGNNFGLALYKLDVNGTLESASRYLNNVFFKRVFVVNDYMDSSNTERREEQRLVFLNFCAKSNITFVDVNEVLKCNYWQKTQSLHEQVQSEYLMRWTTQQPIFASNYTPKVVIQAITNYLKTVQIQSRDVLLYGYPAGDTPSERQSNERYYPRASDEIQTIEKELGPVRIVCTLSETKMPWTISDQPIVLEKPPEKPKKKEGEEEEDEPPEEEEEGKPKFNIYDYQWTNCNGLPKSLPQWYNKLKSTQKKHYSIMNNGAENTYDKLQEYLQLISEENPENKADLEYKKVNLFIQLRYDDVPEHEQEEVAPPREPYKHIVPEEPKLVLPDQDAPEIEPKVVDENAEQAEDE